MPIRRDAWLVLALMLAPTLLPPAARAGSPADDSRQADGLFLQTCVRFAGDTSGLRAWAKQTNFLPLPPQGQAAFLNGLPGIAFDATNTHGKFVLISEDGGECSVVAEHADPDALVGTLESMLATAKIGFKVTDQHTDPTEATLHHREYDATANGHGFSMLVSTTSGAQGGEAMLSVTPP